MIGVAADVSIDEAKRIIRRLQLDAYFCLVNAFRASGYLTKTKLRILQDLSLYFQLSTERHQAEVRRAVNDEELTALADLVTKDDSSYEWICEGRHPVPTHHEDFSYKLPRYVKLRKEAPKTEKVKERKPCSTVPVSATPTNFAKATQTLTVKKEQKEEMVDEVKEEVSVSLLSNTPDIFEAASLEKIAEDLGESLLMYLPLDTKPNLDEIPAIPSLPSLIPIRVGEEFGKMIGELCKTLKDQTGHIQLPLDIAKLTKERLEKKAKQRQRRSNSAAPEVVGGPFKRRRKKGAVSNISDTPTHAISEHGQIYPPGDIGPTLTTPEPPSEHLLNKDILVKVGTGPPPVPPLLTKAPASDLQSPSYHGLQPPTLQRMPGAPHSSTLGLQAPHSSTLGLQAPHSSTLGLQTPHSSTLGLQSPVKSSYPSSLPISPAKSYSQVVKPAISPHSPGMLKFRSSEELGSDRSTDPIKSPADLMSPDQRQAQKQWVASRSEAAWQELSRSEPNSIQVQRHYSQQMDDKRKYSSGADMLAREQWISEQIHGQSKGHKEGGHDLTPEKVMHETLKESQRLKIADLEDRRSEDSEKRKDDERQRIEERLKLDEKHRHEEKRAQHHLVKLDQKIVKIDQKKDGADGAKVFGKVHDPTTSYLSTYMPKPNQAKGLTRQGSVSKLSRSKGKPTDLVTLQQPSQNLSQGQPQEFHKQELTRIEVSKNVRIESIPQGIPSSSASAMSRSEFTNEKKEERIIVKPTIQILAQTPKISTITAHDFKQNRELPQHMRDPAREISLQSRDVIQLPRDATQQMRDSGQLRDSTHYSRELMQQSRDVTQQQRDVTQQSRDVTQQSRDVPQQSRDVTQQPRDVTQQSRDVTQHSRDVTQQSRDTTQHSRDSSLSREVSHSKEGVPTQSSGKADSERKTESGEGKQSIVTSSKLNTTAPTICVRAISKPPTSQSKQPYLPYSSKVSSQDMQMANLYTQQVLQHQLAFMQQQGTPIRSGMPLYKTVNPTLTSSTTSKDTKVASPAGEMSTGRAVYPEKSSAEKADPSQRHLTEKERQEQQRQITDQQRQVILQQSTYRVSPGGQVLVGKFTGTNFDPMASSSQYQLALSTSTATAPPAAPPSKTRTTSETSGSRKSAKPSAYPPPTGGTKPYGPYMQAQLTKPHSGNATEGRSRKAGSGVPEDVFNFPDDDEERNSLRRAEERQKQISRGGDRREKDLERPMSFQQKQQLHSKMLHERQMMELRAIHERKVEEEFKRFEEEFCKNIHKMAGEVSQTPQAQAPPPPQEHAMVSSHNVMTSSQHHPTSSQQQQQHAPASQHHASERRGVEVQHYLPEGRGYPGQGLTITTPHLTLPASSGHLVTSSGIIITHPQSSSYESGEEYHKRKRKIGGQDYINSLLKSALSLLQKTLKIRPKTRLVNPSYPPHIWHQQSMDPKFVEKGLTPIDLMTVKKKLEFGEYPSFEAFYNDVTHFQRNYSEVYPAENQLRQEIDEIMGVFLKELKEIYRSVSTHQSAPSTPSSKKPKPDSSGQS